MVQSSLQLYRNAYTGLPRSIWWLSLVIFINRCGTMVIPFLTVYLTDKGYTLEEAGIVMACFGTGSLVGTYIGGRLTDKIGFFYIQLFSLLANGIFFILLGQMKTLLHISLCIFILSSLGEAFRPANAAAIAAYSDDTNRTRSYSLNRLAVNLGWSIGPAVGGILASINYSWLFWTDGLTCILASLMLYLVLSPQKTCIPQTYHPSTEKSKSAYRDKSFLKGCFFMLLIGICFFQLFTIVPVFYKDIMHLSKVMIGTLLASNGIIIVLVEMVLVYQLERKATVQLFIVLGAFLIGLSFIILNTAYILPVAILSMLSVTFGEMLLFPFMNNFWIKRSLPENRGQYAGVYNMAFSIGNILAPTLASQVAGRIGFPILWTIDFFICTFAAFGFLSLYRNNSFYE